MSITTTVDELFVIFDEPSIHRTTAWRRRKRLEALARHEFANGPRQTTPRAAMARALKTYLVEHGIWVKSCVACGRAFAARRSDAITCSGACRSHRDGRSHRHAVYDDDELDFDPGRDAFTRLWAAYETAGRRVAEYTTERHDGLDGAEFHRTLLEHLAFANEGGTVDLIHADGDGIVVHVHLWEEDE